MGEENYSVIDLTIDSKDFTADNIIHKNEFKKVKDFVNNQIPKNLEDISKEDDFEGYYKTILVEGGRGTGKTTFLKNFYIENLQKTSFNEIEILPFLDPTRIEDKSSLFLTVISLINERVIKKLNDKSNENEIEAKRKFWSDLLNQLAKGLPSISDNPKDPYYWDDDFMIMEKGLSATKSAFDLRKNFKLLIKGSLETLGKKAFLLIVDDVDTDCKKAWNLLETLRKYLCVQGFIIIVSGNIELFSLEVQQKQSSFFNCVSSCGKEKQILELTDQYLRKIFPPRYRISLGNLSYIIDKKKISNSIKPEIRIQYDKGSGEELKSFLERKFNTLGIYNKYQLSAYLDFVLNLPLRSQIDFYRFCISLDENKLEIEQIITLFSEDLFKFNVDADLLKIRPFVINCVILQFLVDSEKDNKKLNDYYQLQPITLDSSLNSALFTLGTVLSERIKEYPDLVFNYMIKIGLIRNVAPILNNTTTSNVKYNFSLQDMIRYSAMGDDIDLRHSTCVLIAYLRSITNKIPGVFEIDETKKNTLFLKKKENSLESIIAQLPYSCSRDSTNNKDYFEYSIYTLISTVYDVVRALESGDDLNSILLKNAQPREYLMAQENDINYEENSEIKGNADIDNVLDEIELKEQKTIENVDSFKTELEDWINFTKTDCKYVQPYVLAKICTRMYYAYSNVSLKNGKGNRPLYEVMQECILLMFNSVLIEESAEYLSNPTINRNNDVDAFYFNLEKIKGEDLKKLLLSRIILTCPFFLYFLDFKNSDDRIKLIIDFCQKVFSDEKKWEDYRTRASCLQKVLKIQIPKKNQADSSSKKTSSPNK